MFYIQLLWEGLWDYLINCIEKMKPHQLPVFLHDLIELFFHSSVSNHPATVFIWFPMFLLLLLGTSLFSPWQLYTWSSFINQQEVVTKQIFQNSEQYLTNSHLFFCQQCHTLTALLQATNSNYMSAACGCHTTVITLSVSIAPDGVICTWESRRCVGLNETIFSFVFINCLFKVSTGNSRVSMIFNS